MEDLLRWHTNVQKQWEFALIVHIIQLKMKGRLVIVPIFPNSNKKWCSEIHIQSEW